MATMRHQAFSALTVLSLLLPPGVAAAAVLERRTDEVTTRLEAMMDTIFVPRGTTYQMVGNPDDDEEISWIKMDSLFADVADASEEGGGSNNEPIVMEQLVDLALVEEDIRSVRCRGDTNFTMGEVQINFPSDLLEGMRNLTQAERDRFAPVGSVLVVNSEIFGPCLLRQDRFIDHGDTSHANVDGYLNVTSVMMTDRGLLVHGNISSFVDVFVSANITVGANETNSTADDTRRLQDISQGPGIMFNHSLVDVNETFFGVVNVQANAQAMFDAGARYTFRKNGAGVEFEVSAGIRNASLSANLNISFVNQTKSIDESRTLFERQIDGFGIRIPLPGRLPDIRLGGFARIEAVAKGKASLESALSYDAGVSVYANGLTAGFSAEASIFPPRLGLDPKIGTPETGFEYFSNFTSDGIRGSADLFVGLRLQILLTGNGAVELGVPVTVGTQLKLRADTAEYFPPRNITQDALGLPIVLNPETCQTCHLAHLDTDFVGFAGDEIRGKIDLGTIPTGPFLPDIRLRDSFGIDIVPETTFDLLDACFVPGPDDVCFSSDEMPSLTPTAAPSPRGGKGGKGGGKAGVGKASGTMSNVDTDVGDNAANDDGGDPPLLRGRRKLNVAKGSTNRRL